MKQNREQFKRLLIFITSLIIIAAFGVLYWKTWNDSYNSEMRDPFWKNGNILMAMIYIAIYVITARSVNGFKVTYLRPAGLFGSQILGILTANVISFVQISLIGRGRLNVMPMVKLTGIEIAIALVWSIAATQVFKRVYPPRRMIIVYGNQNSTSLIRKMSLRQDKYHICASVSCDEDIERIKEQILRYEAVIISDVPSPMRNKLLKFTLDRSIRAYITPKLSDIIIRGSEDFNLFDTPLLLNRNEGLSAEQRFMKRSFDIILVLIAIIIASPFMLLSALAIKLYDRGPVLYKQKRLTIGGKEFNVFKFRSMVVDAEQHGARLAGKNDDRITPVGRILRAIRFDELPQLFNILRGDMSFVGPRPERPEFTAKYEETMPEFKYRLKVKAGLTGYAQVMGKYNTTAYDKLKLDLMYIENQSLLLDLKIMLMTVKTVFAPDTTEGVSEEGSTETFREEHPQRDERELDQILK
ncbi:MAG: exopolysaccharide biosynthesis polyprenyl glycosylphosphotransferase [Ruminococcus sp.]|nr:exopolysaccharide biosynthesis polyprenyl glycosylphosphotransferase [Ruminococcus sp.]